MFNFTVTPSYFPFLVGTSLSQPGLVSSAVKVNIYAVTDSTNNENIVSWSIPVSFGGCTFNVYSSAANQGPFNKLNTTPIQGFYFRDDSLLVTPESKFRSMYYVVEVELPSGQLVRSTPQTWLNTRTTWVQIRATEITRRENLLLNKFVGIPSYIFKRLTFGQRCTNCWNSEIEKIVQDHCPVCLGTSFVGGYFPGFKTLLQYDATPNQTLFSGPGVVEQVTINGWTTNFPKIDVFDLVMRIPDNKLYRVGAVTPTELQSVLVRQVLQLSELDKESIEFNLAIAALPTGITP